MDAPSPRVKNAAGEDFSKYKGDVWKKFLKKRGSQSSDGRQDKRKAELVNLCEKAAEMKQAKLEHEDTVKTTTNCSKRNYRQDGKLSDPKTLTAWTNTFLGIPELTFGDLYS